MDHINNILNPYQTFKTYQDYLLELFISEYDSKYVDIIRERLLKINYFFDSTPDVTYRNLRKLGVDAKKFKSLEYIYNEYQDYMIVTSFLKEKFLKQCYEMLKKNFNISSSLETLNLEEIMNLDFSLYSFDNVVLFNKTDDKKLKAEISRQREKYIQKCKKLGIEPITDPVHVKKILEFKQEVEKYYQENILEYTEFGRRVIRFVDCSTNYELNKKQIIKIARNIVFLERNTSAINIAYKNKNGQHLDFAVIPLFSIVLSGNADLNFLHETFHALESSNIGIGIDLTPEFKMLNEFRTEVKARNALEKLRCTTGFIFDIPGLVRKKIDSYNRYLFLARSFIEQYESILDDSAINNDVDMLIDLFGYKNLLNYGKTLNELYDNSNMLGTVRSQVDTSLLDGHLEKLNKHFNQKSIVKR